MRRENQKPDIDISITDASAPVSLSQGSGGSWYVYLPVGSRASWTDLPVKSNISYKPAVLCDTIPLCYSFFLPWWPDWKPFPPDIHALGLVKLKNTSGSLSHNFPYSLPSQLWHPPGRPTHNHSLNAPQIVPENNDSLVKVARDLIRYWYPWLITGMLHWKRRNWFLLTTLLTCYPTAKTTARSTGYWWIKSWYARGLTRTAGLLRNFLPVLR